MGSWRATCFGPTLRTGHEPWQARSGLEEGRAPARPLLIAAQRKAAPQRGALHSSDPIPPVPGAGMRFMESVTKQSRGVRRYPGLFLTQRTPRKTRSRAALLFSACFLLFLGVLCVLLLMSTRPDAGFSRVAGPGRPTGGARPSAAVPRPIDSRRPGAPARARARRCWGRRTCRNSAAGRGASPEPHGRVGDGWTRP